MRVVIVIASWWCRYLISNLLSDADARWFWFLRWRRLLSCRHEITWAVRKVIHGCRQVEIKPWTINNIIVILLTWCCHLRYLFSRMLPAFVCWFRCQRFVNTFFRPCQLALVSIMLTVTYTSEGIWVIRRVQTFLRRLERLSNRLHDTTRVHFRSLNLTSWLAIEKLPLIDASSWNRSLTNWTQITLANHFKSVL